MIFNHLKSLMTRKSQERLPLFAMISDQSGGAQPQWTQFTVGKAVRDGFKTSVWVYRCVNLIAQCAATVDFTVVDNQGRPVPNHPVQRLLSQPNPEIPAKDLKMLLIQHLQLAGNAYIKKVKPGANTRELWPMLPDKIAPVPSETVGQLLGGYRFQSGGRSELIRPDEVIHLKFEDPANPLLGVSPLMAASKEVDIAVEQSKWNKMSLQNRGNPDGIISFNSDLSREQIVEIERNIREKRSGAENAHKLWVFPASANFQKLTQSPVDLDFIEGRKLTREEICAAFGVPPPMIGIYDQATYSNIQTAERLFWELTMLPQLSGVCDALTWGLRDELGTCRIIPDVSQVKALEDSLDARIGMAKDLAALGIPLTEINRRLQLKLDLSHLNCPPATEDASP